MDHGVGVASWALLSRAAQPQCRQHPLRLADAQ